MDYDTSVLASGNIGESSEEKGVGLQAHEVHDGRTVEGESVLRARRRDKSDSRNRDLKGHKRRVSRERVSDHGQADGTGAGAAAINSARPLREATAGSQGQS